MIITMYTLCFTEFKCKYFETWHINYFAHFSIFFFFFLGGGGISLSLKFIHKRFFSFSCWKTIFLCSFGLQLVLSMSIFLTILRNTLHFLESIIVIWNCWILKIYCLIIMERKKKLLMYSKPWVILLVELFSR